MFSMLGMVLEGSTDYAEGGNPCEQRLLHLKWAEPQTFYSITDNISIELFLLWVPALADPT